MGGRSMKDVGGAVLAGSSPPFLGRERAAVDVDVGPERRSSRYHETCLALEIFLNLVYSLKNKKNRSERGMSDDEGLEVDLSEDVSGACLSLSSARICVCALPP